MKDRFLPYGRQTIEDDDIAAVTSVLRSDFLTTGPMVAQFEAALAEAVDAPHAVVCGNGTQALHLATAALDLGLGDWAIVPAITFLATANAVRYVGGEVVFADVDPDSGLMTVAHAIEAAKRAGGNIKAILPVHLAGLPVDQASIAALARDRGWRIIEDACHALGTVSRLPGQSQSHIGDARLSDACCFSFHPVKTIAMGEGGAITTRDEALAQRMRRLRSHGMVHDPKAFRHPELGLTANGSANPWYYEMPEVGFNYRAPDLNCALGLSQIKKLPRFVARRAELVAAYQSALAPLGNRIKIVPVPDGVAPGWHLFRVLIDFKALGLTRDKVMARLKTHNIGSQVHYIPVHLQPYYRDRYGAAELPGAWHYYERTLSLPLFPSMTESDVARVVASLEKAIEA